MLGGRPDHMPLLAETEPSGIDGFGASAGEYALLGGRADHFRHIAASVVEQLAGVLSIRMDAGRVAENFSQHGNHRLKHLGRNRSRRVVVEIIAILHVWWVH